MSEIKDGGPAFPATIEMPDGNFYKTITFPGMSLRDWFAGMAMEGFLAAPDIIKEAGMTFEESISKWSYQYADAMLRARAQ